MEIFIYDKNRERIGILQNYTSIQWQKCYDERGEFLIVMNETEDSMNYQIGNLLYKNDDKTIGYIEYVSSAEGKLELRGHLDNLSDRINYATAKIEHVEKDVYDLINANKRGLEITTAQLQGLTQTISSTETTYKPLSETISSICKLSGLGYRQVKSGDTFGLFELYKGGLNEDGVLSEDFNNLFVKEYLQDISKFKNYAIVAGEGEGSARRIVYVDRSAGGPKCELFVDARDLQKTYRDDKDVEHTYTDAEYDNVLKQRGEQKLDEVKQIESFKIDYDVTNESFKYGRDWFLGDILKAKSSHYGFVKHMRASKINEVYESDYKVVATLEEVNI